MGEPHLDDNHDHLGAEVDRPVVEADAVPEESAVQAPELIAALRRGTLLVAPRPAVQPGWRAWVCVSGPASHDIGPGWRNRDLTLYWQVREWDPVYIVEDWCWGENDGMRALERHVSNGEDRLWAMVERFGGAGAFTYPWYTDFPG